MISMPSSAVLLLSLLRRGGDGERFLRGHFLEGSAATTTVEVERCFVGGGVVIGIGKRGRDRERPTRCCAETGLERSRSASTRVDDMRLRLP